MVVVDPYSNFNPEDCKPMSQPIAYVSVGEVAKGAPYEHKISPEWVIGKNIAWNNNKVIDQTQKNWQTFFIHQLIDPLWKKGYRGFFLDTLDSYTQAVHDLTLQQHQIDGIVSLIQHIKTKYPDAKIILNRGFHFLPRVQSQIDAVVIESLYHAWNQEKKAYEDTPLAEQKKLLTEIDKIRQMQLPIIIIDYLPPSQQSKAPYLAQKIAEQGMIPWITNNLLHEIYIKKIQEVPRKILVMFTNDDKLQIQFIPALRYVGTILEYMGYVPRYLDLNTTDLFPGGNLKSKYAGIVLWLDNQKTKNIAMLHWVQQQIKNGIPVVFLQGFGVPIESQALVKLGLLTSPAKSSIKTLHIAKIDHQFVGYEVKPIMTPYYFYPLHSPSSQILLQVKNDKQQMEDAVAITPWGGYALNPYVIQFLPNYYALWVIDPFKFFHQALRLDDFPIPDTTTENGRRLMSVHIDGDGFANPAKWIGGRFAAEELRDHVLKQFRIPTSLSIITAEIAPNGVHPKLSPQLMTIARSIFALPWIEIASHSFSHPFNWQSKAYKTTDSSLDEPYVLNIPHYTFNLTTEIGGSVDFINKYLAPADKKSHLFFWSGLANPSAQALDLADHLHILSINGLSDTNIDDHHPALTGIRPMGVKMGGHYQIFAPIQMDFNYMNRFAGPIYGFENVIQTLKLTDKPRRFKPIDLYYHIYSASYPASLQALIKVYRWALTQPVMNIYISDYIKKVLDYYQIIIGKYNTSWLIYSSGELRELRSLQHFGYPDLMHSQNIVGFKENKDDMYIHLGPNHMTVLNYQKERPNEPYLAEANARVTAFDRSTHQLVIKLQGYMPLQFTLANISHCRVSTEPPLTVKPNLDQTISYSSSKERVEIHIYC